MKCKHIIGLKELDYSVSCLRRSQLPLWHSLVIMCVTKGSCIYTGSDTHPVIACPVDKDPVIIPYNTHTHTHGFMLTDFSEALDASGGILRAEWERVLDNEERVWALRLLVTSKKGWG